jgi:hypothetical protein
MHLFVLFILQENMVRVCSEYWMQTIELTEDQARAAIRMSDSDCGKAGD